ncbi:hypothetical protein DLAC_00258 [Tieghemostelium lacteum]|uniref:Uncharacterized protein n=1 Tax=Tieghemostelium lacteum TaxID=361077 RepID=A0A152A993_TIELA|nr:hypothetical protein DLAC_00258 [Tieghemostelium lacteum]|eukprot:KYR02793.1 hypothetical protein DLAC_00258 [Tieghemostelium lacteum]
MEPTDWYSVMANWKYISSKSQKDNSTSGNISGGHLMNDDRDHQDIIEKKDDSSMIDTKQQQQQQQQDQQQEPTTPRSDTGSTQGGVVSATGLMVDALLKSVRIEKDEILKINLLLFLQENSMQLIEDDSKRFEKIYSTLQTMLYSQGEGYNVKCQVLSTMTSMIICESVIIKTQPSLVEQFINSLLEIISRVNQSIDRLLRGSACLCLLEFELTYPCILSPFLSTLTHYCQVENTHLIQNYTILLSTVLQNTVVNSYEDLTNINGVLTNGGIAQSPSISSPTSGVLTNGGISIKSQGGIISTSLNQSGILSPPSFGSTPNGYMNMSQSYIPSQIGASLSKPYQSPINMSYTKAGITRAPSTSNIFDNTDPSSSNTSSKQPTSHNSIPNISILNLSPTTPNTFTIPQFIKYSPIFNIPKHKYSNKITQLQLQQSPRHRLSELSEKDVFKCASTIADQSNYLNQWGLTTVVLQLIPLIDIANIPHNFFRNHLHILYKFFFTNNVVPFHLILYLNMIFPDLYNQEEYDLLMNRLLVIVNDPYISLENRIVAIDWFLSIISSGQQTPDNDYLSFYPMSLDSLPLKETKIYALVKTLVLHRDTLPPPSDLLKSLICLEEFKYQNEHSQATKVVFSSLLMMLTSFPVVIYERVEAFLTDLFVHYPQFLNPIIELLNGIQDKQIRLKLFLQLSKIINSLTPMRFLIYLPFVEIIVLEDKIDPTILLNKIFDLIRRRQICQDGNWYIGNIVLSICRRVIVCHHIPFLLKPLRLILSSLAYYFSNLEIRDRASFYDRLITHLPDDKIKALLSVQTGHNDQSNLNGLLNNTGSDQKPKILLKSLPHFISVLPAITSSKRIQHSFQLDQFEYPSNTDTTSGLDYSHFEQDYQIYQSYLRDPQKLSAKIIIPHQIRYRKNLTSNTTNSIPLKIYALLLQFQNSQYYSQIYPVRIPYLCYPDQQQQQLTTSENTQELEFPYSYDVDLTFKPLYPIPGNFQIKMIFNDDEGKTCKADGSSVSISFQDLFMRIPVPIHIKSLEHQQKFLLSLFDKIWKLSETSPISNNINNNIVTSVKQISIQKTQIQSAIQSKLALYCIDQINTNQNREGESKVESENLAQQLKVIIFLPPQYHLLFLFEINEKSTLIHIKTDYWRSLASIDQYILYLTSK